MPTDQTKNAEPQITSIEDWNAPREVSPEAALVVTLPSGRTIRMRRTMDAMGLLQAGKIPNPLASVVTKMISEGSTDFGKAAAEEDDPEVLRQFFDMINNTMSNAFVEPRVSCPDIRGVDEEWDDYMGRVTAWTPPQGTLSVFDIELPDKMFVFAVAQGAAADLARFRDESESAMGSVQPGKNVVKPTKRTGGGKPKK